MDTPPDRILPQATRTYQTLGLKVAGDGVIPYFLKFANNFWEQG